MNESADSIAQLVVTGAGGLVGACVVNEAKRLFPGITVTEVRSGRSGGVDLVAPDACERLLESVVVPQPRQTAVIHCAADLAIDGPAVVTNNVAMTTHVADWSKRAGLAFALYVSSVSVFKPGMFDNNGASIGPITPYGESKLLGERVWLESLGEANTAIVRLAGVLGWQAQPQMFWNRLLLTALAPQYSAGGQYKAGAERNYITGPEVAECLLAVAMNRLSGVHLAAGLESVKLGDFMTMLEDAAGSFPGWKAVEAADDRVVYPPSEALIPWLKPFKTRFDELWNQRPQAGGWSS